MYDSEVIIDNNQVQAKNGSFVFDELRVTTTPGSLVILHFSLFGLDENYIDKEFLKVPQFYPIFIRKCKSGEYFTEFETCLECDTGTYMIEPPMEPKYCIECPQEGYCYGANLITPRDGYIRLNTETDVLIECLNPDACLAGNEENPLGICDTGYDGLMCGSCAENFV